MAWDLRTPTHGKLARITKSGTVIDYSSRWSINVVRDAVVFGRQGQVYKDSLPGGESWTGAAEFYFVKSSEQSSVIGLMASTSALAITSSYTATDLKFCFDTTLHSIYSTNGMVVTGMTIDAPVGDLIRCSFTFQGSGQIRFTS